MTRRPTAPSSSRTPPRLAAWGSLAAWGTLGALGLLGWAPDARAAGTSADIELVRPTWSYLSLPGIDSPVIDGGTFRIGGLTQYEKDPLILYELRDRNPEEIGPVVSNRQTLQIGGAWDFGRFASMRVMYPVALQWGSDVDQFAHDGPVAGDVVAGFRLGLVRPRTLTKGFWLTLRADGAFPSGTKQAWMGEDTPRVIAGPLMMGRIRLFDILADVNFTARPPVETPADFTLGSELVTGLGVRYNVWPERASVGAGLITRGGLGFIGLAGAENPAELTSSLQIWPSRDLLIDAGVGKGVADGYGTTGLRAMVGLTWIHHKPPAEPPPRIVVTEVPEEAPPPRNPPPEPPPVEEKWGEEELAKVKGEQIVIRDPIQFEFNTERILPASLPTLRYVADLMDKNWQIAHVVVEGHASEEGSFVYNYDLSIRRARAVWEELIRVGVHPDRISYRGMGETVPSIGGGDEASLATNRRVEFDIIKQYEMGDTPPPLRENVRLPWSGDPATIINPPPPPPLPPKEKPKAKPGDPLDLNAFLEEDEPVEIPSEKQPSGGTPAAPPPGNGP
jgi:outer membrane protein OmpA-like peptidoglycan-associated protein